MMTMTMLGIRAPLKKPWKATIVATTKIANATSQCPATPPMSAADHDPMDETVVHCHVRGEIITLRRRVFDLSVLGHRLLHDCALSGKRELAQLTLQGNGAMCGQRGSTAHRASRRSPVVQRSNGDGSSPTAASAVA